MLPTEWAECCPTLHPAADGLKTLMQTAKLNDSPNSVKANAILALSCKAYQTICAASIEVECFYVIKEAKTFLRG